MPDRPTAATEQQRRDHTYFDGPLVHPMVDDSRVDPSVNYWLDPAKGRSTVTGPKPAIGAATRASSQRVLLCHEHAELQYHLLCRRAAGRGDDRFRLCHGRWPSRGGNLPAAHVLLGGRLRAGTYPPLLFLHYARRQQSHCRFRADPLRPAAGQSLLAKDIEELVSAYHPGLRSFIAGSSRTSLDLVLGMQDGIYHALHTLSKSGTLRDYGEKILPGNIATWGHDFPPRPGRATDAGRPVGAGMGLHYGGRQAYPL